MLYAPKVAWMLYAPNVTSSAPRLSFDHNIKVVHHTGDQHKGDSGLAPCVYAPLRQDWTRPNRPVSLRDTWYSSKCRMFGHELRVVLRASSTFWLFSSSGWIMRAVVIGSRCGDGMNQQGAFVSL